LNITAPYRGFFIAKNSGVTMNLLLKIPQDKLLHFIVGLFVYMAFHFIHPVVGLIAGLVIGVGKEVYDDFHKDKHTPN
jgi:hypothetical protein